MSRAVSRQGGAWETSHLCQASKIRHELYEETTGNAISLSTLLLELPPSIDADELHAPLVSVHQVELYGMADRSSVPM